MSATPVLELPGAAPPSAGAARSGAPPGGPPGAEHFHAALEHELARTAPAEGQKGKQPVGSPVPGPKHTHAEEPPTDLVAVAVQAVPRPAPVATAAATPPPAPSSGQALARPDADRPPEPAASAPEASAPKPPAVSTETEPLPLPEQSLGTPDVEPKATVPATTGPLARTAQTAAATAAQTSSVAATRTPAEPAAPTSPVPATGEPPAPVVGPQPGSDRAPGNPAEEPQATPSARQLLATDAAHRVESSAETSRTGSQSAGAPPAAVEASRPAQSAAPHPAASGSQPPPSTPAAAPATPGAPGRSPAEQTPAPALDMQQTIDSIQASVALAARRGVSQARIALQPAELGEVRIHLTQTSDGLLARVTADSPVAAQALAGARAELHHSLSTLGTSLLRLEIGASGEEPGRRREAGLTSGTPGGATGRGQSSEAEGSEEAIEAPEGVHAPAARGELVDVLA